MLGFVLWLLILLALTCLALAPSSAQAFGAAAAGCDLGGAPSPPQVAFGIAFVLLLLGALCRVGRRT
jgi:hypothetical protein